jgi:thiamine-phosphate pyrophosphorylase
MPFKVPRVYPITDRNLSGLSHLEQVKQLIHGGATLIQLREKDLDPLDFYREAEPALKYARARGVQLIINDRVDLAHALKADGVHLGQTDLPPGAARAILGNQAIIGFSTHNLRQAMAASGLPVDYLAVGPIFSTSSKKEPDPVIGLDGLRRIRATIDQLPIVAIGGITAASAQSVIKAGADSVAMISALFSTGNAASSLAELLEILGNS